MPPKFGFGDNEFDGNGPDVSSSVSVFVRNGNVYATISIAAAETKPDRTTAQGSTTIRIWSQTATSKATRLKISDDYDNHSYRDNDHDVDVFSGSGPVAQYRIMGDGKGNDVGRHTQVTIVFNPITIDVETCASTVCATRTYTFTPTNQTYMPPHTGFGDKEFDGNGPDVKTSVRLYTQNGDLYAYLSMAAVETKPDRTVAQGDTNIRILRQNSEWKITKVLSQASDLQYYRDTDHDIDVLYGRGPVNKYYVMGDGKGDDVGRHTQMTVVFNPVEVKLQRKGQGCS